MSEFERSIISHEEDILFLSGFNNFEHMHLPFRILNFDADAYFGYCFTSFWKYIFFDGLIVDKLIHEIFVLPSTDLTHTAFIITTNFALFMSQHIVIT